MKISEQDALFDPLNRMLDFAGRSSRLQFWPFLMIFMTANALAPILSSPLLGESVVGDPATINMGAILADYMMHQGLVFAVFVVPLMSVITRRLHDIGWSGLWAAPLLFLHLIVFLLQAKVIADSVRLGEATQSPYFGVLNTVTTINNLAMIAVALLCARPSEPDPNSYGNPQFS